ncbi:RNA-directed DNA polymerase from mobile element jockey [Labeo rohita]|uniref:RNA-directed DNA polymerase from mobile element jockey n=1 Tax=Labeo rohita TaxID=84645 RepID=A0ABQ8MX12_LABRO|nr:RNA-directed DNA polymerase from mobile element jockey [Labeo rohita]
MKSLERLVLHRIKADLSPTLDPDQYAYRANRSTDDAISAVLHTVLCHLEHQGSYARLLFLDFSSAFNTVLPNRLFTKMSDLGLQHNICLWIKDFLTERPQSVRMGPHNSSTLTISTGVPQGCLLSPFLYSLYSYDCIPSYNANIIIKFVDDTTVVGLITGGDKSAYREEIKRLMVWRNQDVHTPLYINEEMVERVSCFKFLGTYISEDLLWTKNIMALVKKAQKRLYFLRMLRKVNLPQRLLVSFYSCSIESILTYGMLVWYGSSTAADKKALQRVIKTAQNIIAKQQLPTLENIFTSRCLQKIHNILKDSYHPAHHLFERLPSGKCYKHGKQAIKTRTTRFMNSFYPKAITILNAELKKHS